MDASDYRTENPDCEICSILRLDNSRHPATELHHLWHATQRYEFLANWLMVCRTGHAWLHAHPGEGLIFGWLVKAGKGELCWTSWNLNVGRNLYAVVGRQYVRVEHEWRRSELLAWLKSRGADSPYLRA